MSITGRRDITRLRKVRTSTGESTASSTETMRSSRSTLLITIWESPVQPTIRVNLHALLDVVRAATRFVVFPFTQTVNTVGETAMWLVVNPARIKTAEI